MTGEQSNNNEEQFEKKKLLTYLLFGGYVVWKVLTAKGDSKGITYNEIEEIVNEAFRFEDSSEFATLLLACFAPDILDFRRDLLEDLIKPRISWIDKRLVDIASSRDEYIPNTNNERAKELTNNILENCLFKTEKYVGYVTMPFNILKLNVIETIVNSKTYIAIFTSIKKALVEFYAALYIYKDSEEKAIYVLKETYSHSIIKAWLP